ncbi:MAG: hypothetical protein KVP17_001768 [Porospora cf. gigantea B]|uniref:uncharacterized protein n=1 Tax=Porospora cf. gigantea B TaxID=2853592 RepID=UPI0035718590|nr:MAG: hypothetical protein KVP17_001768 [Porospora cf. gigantea B]
MRVVFAGISQLADTSLWIDEDVTFERLETLCLDAINEVLPGDALRLRFLCMGRLIEGDSLDRVTTVVGDSAPTIQCSVLNEARPPESERHTQDQSQQSIERSIDYTGREAWSVITLSGLVLGLCVSDRLRRPDRYDMLATVFLYWFATCWMAMFVCNTVVCAKQRLLP